ncbi:hypothetical protein GCM10027018_26920 [Paenibacillus thermoaerophilus]
MAVLLSLVPPFYMETGRLTKWKRLWSGKRRTIPAAVWSDRLFGVLDAEMIVREHADCLRPSTGSARVQQREGPLLSNGSHPPAVFVPVWNLRVKKRRSNGIVMSMDMRNGKELPIR